MPTWVGVCSCLSSWPPVSWPWCPRRWVAGETRGRCVRTLAPAPAVVTSLGQPLLDPRAALSCPQGLLPRAPSGGGSLRDLCYVREGSSGSCWGTWLWWLVAPRWWLCWPLASTPPSTTVSGHRLQADAGEQEGSKAGNSGGRGAAPRLEHPLPKAPLPGVGAPAPRPVRGTWRSVGAVGPWSRERARVKGVREEEGGSPRPLPVSISDAVPTQDPLALMGPGEDTCSCSRQPGWVGVWRAASPHHIHASEEPLRLDPRNLTARPGPPAQETVRVETAHLLDSHFTGEEIEAGKGCIWAGAGLCRPLPSDHPWLPASPQGPRGLTPRLPGPPPGPQGPPGPRSQPDSREAPTSMIRM